MLLVSVRRGKEGNAVEAARRDGEQGAALVKESISVVVVD